MVCTCSQLHMLQLGVGLARPWHVLGSGLGPYRVGLSCVWWSEDIGATTIITRQCYIISRLEMGLTMGPMGPARGPGGGG